MGKDEHIHIISLDHPGYLKPELLEKIRHILGNPDIQRVLVCVGDFTLSITPNTINQATITSGDIDPELRKRMNEFVEPLKKETPRLHDNLKSIPAETIIKLASNPLFFRPEQLDAFIAQFSAEQPIVMSVSPEEKFDQKPKTPSQERELLNAKLQACCKVVSANPQLLESFLYDNLDSAQWLIWKKFIAMERRLVEQNRELLPAIRE